MGMKDAHLRVTGEVPHQQKVSLPCDIMPSSHLECDVLFSPNPTTTTILAKKSPQMSRETPKMSQTTRDILLKVRKMVPPMLEKFHKGATTPPSTPLQLLI